METAIYLLIIGLIFIIIGLILNYYKTRKAFQNKIEILQKIIIEMNQNIENQNHRVKLSDDLMVLIKSANQSLSTSIYDFNFDLISKLVTKK